MQRLLPALLFALCCHTLLLLLPYPEKSSTPPVLPGEKTIRISLSENSVATPENKPPLNEEEEPPKKPEPLPEKKQPEPVVQETPVVQQEPPPVPVALHAQSVKKQIHQKPVPPAPVTSPVLQKPPQTVSHKRAETAPPVAPPVTVKATPLYMENLKPEYPPIARRRNWQGTVILSVTVSEQGSVNEIMLHKSSGHELLDNTALKTVKNWRFIPGRKDDQAVAMEVLVPIHFKLN